MSTDFRSKAERVMALANAGRMDLAGEEAVSLLTEHKVLSLVPFLPGLLTLRGQPFSLDNHFQFEPLFNSYLVGSTVYKTGRQIGKSVSMISSSVTRCGLIPDYRIMYVTPLFSQVQRLSNEVARPLLRESPIGKLMSGTKAEESVLRRTFFNRSRMEFTFASLTADRVRGASNDELNVDELQDLRSDHLPVILETLSASKKYGIIRKFGTPKTPENVIEGEWRKSSQGVWCIPCPYCRKENFACLSHDLDRMIGPYHPDISENRPGTICAAPGCARPISPANGFWVHRYPHKRGETAGYHAPQPIMHLHYSDAQKWALLLRKRESSGLYTPARYQNEVLGESAGEGLQLITREEIQRACDETRKNYPKDPRKVLQGLDYTRYKLIFMAVDWGGGGESGLSLTVPVVLAMKYDGKIDVLFACRLTTPNDHLQEAQQVLELFRLFRCQRLVHDYTGAGALRETVLVSAGVDRRVLVPIQYVGGGTTSLMTRVAGTQRNMRTYYRLNKSRSLLYTISAIRTRLIRFFAYDYRDQEDAGLLEDFLALYEERIEHKSGSNIYVIDRNHAMPDDFAQAVNIGCAGLWYMTKSWPTFDVIPDEYKYSLTPAQEAELEPQHPWADAIAVEGLEGFAPE